jgi:hypothetical protein
VRFNETVNRTELGVPGVPESAVGEALLSRLPVASAPAPWTCACEAVVWGARGGRAATAALAPGLRGSTGYAVAGGLVRYLDTPVGPYDEVLGMVASRTGRKPWGSVAFMAVDSEASLVGGRTNWAMPKTLGTFAGEVATGTTLTVSGADEVRWRVSATPKVIGPAIPVVTRGTARQQFADGRIGSSPLTARGRVRPALVTVEVDSDGPLPTWLRPGRHLGAITESVTFTLGEPQLQPSS